LTKQLTLESRALDQPPKAKVMPGPQTMHEWCVEFEHEIGVKPDAGRQLEAKAYFDKYRRWPPLTEDRTSRTVKARIRRD
jgi:hypothetical protein